MNLGNSVAGHVNVVYGAHLKHNLVNHCGSCSFIDVAYVNRRIFILLPISKELASRNGVRRQERGRAYQCLFCAMVAG